MELIKFAATIGSLPIDYNDNFTKYARVYTLSLMKGRMVVDQQRNYFAKQSSIKANKNKRRHLYGSQYSKHFTIFESFLQTWL